MSCPEHAAAAKMDNVQEAALQDEAAAGTSAEELCPAAPSADESTVAVEQASPEILGESDYENWYGHGYDYNDVAATPVAEPTVTDTAANAEVNVVEEADAPAASCVNADIAVEAPADVTVVAEAEASVIADTQAVITDSATTPPAETSDLADENYFYEKYYQGRYTDEANSDDEEAEYEYYTGCGHDEYWTASAEAVAEPVQSEPQAQCEAEAPAESGLANDEYEPACSESYRSAYGCEYDSALEVAETPEEPSMPAETAVVETADDSGFEYEYDYDGTEYWNVSEPVETETTTDETTNWDDAADELEMLDDAELHGEESEYEACEQTGEVETPVADAADTTTSWDNGSESWTEEESWESETDAVEEEMIETDAAEDYSCTEFDYENHNESCDADAVANEPVAIDATGSDECDWSGEEYDVTSDEYDTEAMEADVEVSESSDETIDETPEAAESCDPCPTGESEVEMTDVEEPIDPVLPDPASAVTRLEQLQEQLLQAAAQAYQGVRSRVAGMADRLHFIAVTEAGAAECSVPVDEFQR